PELLRRLGLVIDLEIPAARLPVSSFGALKRLRVEPTFVPAAVPDEAYTPATRYLLDVRVSGDVLPFPVFAAAPRRAAAALGIDPIRDLEIVGGLLNLGLPVQDDIHTRQFDLIQID